MTQEQWMEKRVKGFLHHMFCALKLSPDRDTKREVRHLINSCFGCQKVWVFGGREGPVVKLTVVDGIIIEIDPEPGVSITLRNLFRKGSRWSETMRLLDVKQEMVTVIV